MDVYKFRQYDLDRTRKVLSDLFQYNLPPNLTGKLETIESKNNVFKGIKCENEMNIWRITINTPSTESVFEFDVPKLIKQNYFLLDGNYYCPPLILELSPVDYNPKSKLHSIYLRPHVKMTLDVENDKVSIGFSNKINLSLFKKILNNEKVEQDELDKVWSFLGITNPNNVKMSVSEFIDKFIFIGYYKKVVSNYISPTHNNFTLLEIIEYVEKMDELDFSDINNRRIVFADYLFEGVYDLYDKIVKVWYNKKRISLQNNSSIVTYNGFATNMKRGGLVDKSLPWSVSINKCTQSLKGMDSDTKLKRSWMSASESQFGIICPISVSAGNMGKVLYLTDSAQINMFGKLSKLPNRTEVLSQQNNMVAFMSTVDTSRANMAAKQITQVSNSKYNQRPYVFNKNHINSNVYDIKADKNGEVIYTSDNIMIVEYNGVERATYPITPYKKIDGVNSIILKEIKQPGDKFKAGDLLVTYTPGLMKLGYRVKIMWSNFFGYTADDAFVISESFARRTFAEYGDTIYIPITKDTTISKKFNIGDYNLSIDYVLEHVNEKPKHTPIDFDGLITGVKYHSLQNLNSSDLLCENTQDIVNTLVTGQKIEREEIEELLNDNGQTYNEYIALSSQKYEFSTKRLSKIKDEFRINEVDDIIGLIQVDTIDLIGTGLGDKFTNLYAGKGVVSKIIPDDLMPKIKDTNEIPDIIFNPIGLPRRNNLGVVLESVVGNIIDNLEHTKNDQMYSDKLEFINENLIQPFDTEQYESIKEDIEKIRSDVVYADVYFTRLDKEGLTLFFDSFEHPNLTQLIDVAKDYCAKFDIPESRIFRKSKIEVKKELLDYLGEYDVPFEYEDIEFEALITNNVYLKLSHNSYSKYNAVGINLRVNQSTGQSITGRKVSGSSHISWMTTAGLLGHKQTTGGTLKELLTVMADANVSDKLQMLKSYIITGSTQLKKRYKSKTYNFINQNMKFLGIKLTNE